MELFAISEERHEGEDWIHEYDHELMEEILMEVRHSTCDIDGAFPLAERYILAEVKGK